MKILIPSIDFNVDGGITAFLGLAKLVTIDRDALSAADTARLRNLVHLADFFARPDHGPAPRMPDARAYRIAIDDGAQCRTMTVAEPIADGALRDLVAELYVQASAIRNA